MGLLFSFWKVCKIDDWIIIILLENIYIYIEILYSCLLEEYPTYIQFHCYYSNSPIRVIYPFANSTFLDLLVEKPTSLEMAGSQMENLQDIEAGAKAEGVLEEKINRGRDGMWAGRRMARRRVCRTRPWKGRNSRQPGLGRRSFTCCRSLPSSTASRCKTHLPDRTAVELFNHDPRSCSWGASRRNRRFLDIRTLLRRGKVLIKKSGEFFPFNAFFPILG